MPETVPTPMPETTRSGKVIAGLWSAVWRYRRRTFAALVLMVLAKLAAIVVPLVLKAIVDRFSQPTSLTESAPVGGTGASQVLILPVFLLLAYALLRFSGTLFTELRDLVFARVTLRTVISFSERTFAHLLALSPRFHVQRNTGSLIRDVERGTGGIGFLLSAGLFTVLPTLIEFGGVLVIMAMGYSPWFTLIILLTFVVYGGFTMALTGQRALQQRRVNEMDSSANGRLVDSLLNYETVKTHAREDFERRRYAEMCGQWIEGSVTNQRALSRLHVGQSAIIAVGVAAVMLLAGEQTVRGTMTVGDLVLVNSYILQICLPLNTLGFVFREARDALVNTEKLLDLLAVPVEIRDRPESQPLQVRQGGSVAFEHVSFSYEAGRQILFDVDLEIPAGHTVAVVGGSGSGKSTLARLLLRLYDAQAGRITVDGQDLRLLQLASLREHIGVVPQDTVLFNETIAYNIGYGRLGAGMAEIIEAARAAQVHEFILSLPQQYDTVVGERGLKLSGGEKQRIAIARAFLKNPPIMIFDEATSALDTRAERAIQGELDRIATGRTTLVIAHRLSTIVNADQIIVMDKGRIVERGRHEELLGREGLYAQLWNLQRQQQELERTQRRMARQPVNLASLLATVVDSLALDIRTRGVTLDSRIDLAHAGVTGDPTALAQVLQEVCWSALASTPPGGRMTLELRRREGQVVLDVADGRHLGAPDTAPPPRREGDTPLDPLAMRSIIERQGGRFDTVAPGPQHGLRYTLQLPLRAIDVVPWPQQATPAEGDLAGLRLLCIDDQVDARESLQALLGLEGAEVQAFASGREALAWLEALPAGQWPDGLLCDIALGDEDGHDVVRALRALEQQRGAPERLPAIALSGLALPEDRARALAAGFQLHLAKPVDPGELVASIRALVPA